MNHFDPKAIYALPPFGYKPPTMQQFDAVRMILLEEFVRIQARNPQFSMRAYAKKLGVAQSAISEVLAGKRPLTKKSAEKILQGLDRDPNEISQLIEASGVDAPQKFHAIDMDSYRLVADWHYYAILSLSETKDFESSPQWIAARLGIDEKTAQEAIERLLRLEMLKLDKKSKKLKPTGRQYEAISVLAVPALRKANRQNLELASQALEEVPLEDRDFTAITLCFDPSRMDDARKMIKNFRRNFNRVMESGHKKEVYKLCVQLFPLSKRGPR